MSKNISISNIKDILREYNGTNNTFYIGGYKKDTSLYIDTSNYNFPIFYYKNLNTQQRKGYTQYYRDIMKASETDLLAMIEKYYNKSDLKSVNINYMGYKIEYYSTSFPSHIIISRQMYREILEFNNNGICDIEENNFIYQLPKRLQNKLRKLAIGISKDRNRINKYYEYNNINQYYYF